MFNVGRVSGIIIGFLILLYPLAIYLGTQYWQPWMIAVSLLSLLLLRLMTTQAHDKSRRLILLIGIVYCGIAVWDNSQISLRFYPVLINLTLFLLFTASLFFPPTAIERLARLQHPDLPAEGVCYTRKVTIVWCFFFIINGSIALLTAVWGSFAWWSLYNGLIAYLLMGSLMGIEYLVRIRTQDYVR